MKVRQVLSIPAALAIGVAIHVDWHLARPTHHRLSLGWPYHWLLAIPVFAAAAWYLARRWPEAASRATAHTVLLGVLLGAVLEPLGEVVLAQATLAEAFGHARLHAFALFLAAGLVTLPIIMAITGKKAKG